MRILHAILFLSAVAAQSLSIAQPNLSTQEMVDQLKAPAISRVTRSLRNLEVQAVASPPPSLSLQVQFDFNSAHVKLESREALKNLAQALSSSDLLDASFRIEGHTDAKGKGEYNLRLSQTRANAVRDFLVLHGIDTRRLASIGKGSAELANVNDPFAAENRRVRIVNLLN